MWRRRGRERDLVVGQVAGFMFGERVDPWVCGWEAGQRSLLRAGEDGGAARALAGCGTTDHAWRLGLSCEGGGGGRGGRLEPPAVIFDEVDQA